MKQNLQNLLILFLLSYSCQNQSFVNSNNENVESLNLITTQIDSNLAEIEKLGVKIAQKTVDLYSNGNPTEAKIEDLKDYSLAKNNVLYRPFNTESSCVFVPAFKSSMKEIPRIILTTEPIEKDLMEITKNLDIVIQAYYIDTNSYCRIYPPFNVLTMLESNLDIRNFNFFYLADPTHNTSKNSTWVNDIYVDPAGKGWMISSLTPVYVDNTFYGVLGLDISIKNLLKKYNSTKNNLVVVDQNGIVVASSNHYCNLLSIPSIDEYKYFEVIKNDQNRSEDFSLKNSKSKSIRNLYEQMMNNENQSTFSFEVEEKKVIVNKSKILTLNWILLEIIDL